MSVVSICNQAISWVGGNPITSLDDNSTEAKLCKANYAPLRDAVLEAADWSFAKRRYKLNQDTETPAFGYQYQFTVPAEVMRVIKPFRGSVTGSGFGEKSLEWAFEDRKVLINLAEVYILAIARVEDTNKFSRAFEQALAARIAADIAIPITASKTVMNDMFTLYEKKLDIATATDGQQGSREKFSSTELVGARRAGARGIGPTV